MRLYRTIPSMLVLAALAGCASNSVSESQCIAGDWQTVGYRDGANGYRSTELLEHQNACVKHGVIPDRASYMAGWEKGVREYCEANNGYDVGERGYGHKNVCPDDQREAFLTAYHDGRELYLARSDVSNLEQAISQREYRLDEIKAELISSATQQFDPTLTPAARVDLLALTERLAEEQGRINAELPQMRQQLAFKTQQLATLEH
ncbi:MAG: DUF2799 domain-containing protein [Proteobacteria bacterium]|nr:DUF2799 domain-containing protein [Pseudomonadota bacterium]